MKRSLMVCAAAVAAATPHIAGAAILNFESQITELNNSGVSGFAELAYDDVANTLAVSLNATGLEPNQLHVQHIHGRFDSSGAPADSVSPTFAAGADADMDGFIELEEGLPFYGPIVLELRDDTAPGVEGFPTAPDGTINFNFTYDLLNTPAFGAGFSAEDLIDLALREIVIHGMSVAPGVGAGTPGEVNGDGGYLAVLPVASGEISAVPLPAAAWMLITALGGLFGASRLRRKTAAA